MRGKHRLRVYKKKVLRRTIGSKSEEVVGGRLKKAT
jgi:hypothetical protein